MSIALPSVKQRTLGIGGSDAAAVAGEDPYRSPLDVYLEKRGLVEPFEGNLATTLGTLCEDAIAEAYVRETGRRVRRVNRPFVHERLPFIRGHIDRRVVGDRERIVEIKLVGRWAQQDWGDPGTDEVPPRVLLQAQHYLGLTGANLCDVVALFGTDLGIYPVQRSVRLIENLYEIERVFWREHVERECPPPATRPGDALKLWPEPEPGKIVEATGELPELVAAFVSLKALEKDVSERVEALKESICREIGDAEELRLLGEKLLTWKAQSSMRIDVTRLKAEAPDIAEKFATTTTTRVLRVCKAAQELPTPTEPHGDDDE